MNNFKKPILEEKTNLVIDLEKKRALLVDNSADRVHFPTIRLTPIVALMISLMDGSYTRIQIVEIIEKLLGQDRIECENALDKCLNMFSGQIIENEDDTIRQLPSPKEVLQSVKKYDIDDLVIHKLPPYPATLIYCATQNCNFKCKYCFEGAGENYVQNENYLPIERWREIIKESSKAGTTSVVFGGGDPMLRDNLEDYIKIAADYGLFCRASTRLKLSEERIKRIYDSGLSCIQLSIDSYDETMVDFLAGRKGTFKGLVSNFNFFNKYDIEIMARSVLTKHNIEHYRKWAEFCFENGADTLASTVYFASCGRHDRSLYPDKSQINKFLEDGHIIKEKYKNTDKKIYFDSNYASFVNADIEYISMKRPYCRGSRGNLLIKHDGKASFCDTLSFDDRFVVGDLMENSVIEIWNGDEIKQWRNPDRALFKGSECEECSLFDKCLPKRCYLRTTVAYGKPYEKDPWCPKNEKEYRSYIV